MGGSLGDMEYGVHLPLISFAGESRSLQDLRAYAVKARDLGYAYLCTNDHLLFSRPWLDGPTALSAVLDVSGDMRLATTVALPVLRGPVATAKALGAIDMLSGGRMTVGVGPGSSEADYKVAGLEFSKRWKRFDESISALRALWSGGPFTERSTRSATWTFCLDQLNRTVLRSGSQVGDQKQASVERRDSVTAGWRPGTTRRQRYSRKHSLTLPTNLLRAAKTRPRSQTASPQCGCM